MDFYSDTGGGQTKKSGSHTVNTPQFELIDMLNGANIFNKPSSNKALMSVWRHTRVAGSGGGCGYRVRGNIVGSF
jgi:hypothetical protein